MISVSDITLEQRKVYCRNKAKKKIMNKLKMIRGLREMR